MMNTKLWVMIFVMGLSGYAGAVNPPPTATPAATEEPLTPPDKPADPEHDGFKNCEKYAGHDYVIRDLKDGLKPGSYASVHCTEVISLYEEKLKKFCVPNNQKFKSFNESFPGGIDDPTKLKGYVECKILTAFSVENDSPRIEQILERKNSADGRMTCRGPKTYTMDFRSCEKALSYYNAVIIAEQGMELQQKVRTDLHNSNSQKNTNAALARGESQTAVYDAAIDSSNHSKSMETEKMLAYSGAVSALSYAYSMIKSEGDIREDCEDHFKKVIEKNFHTHASAECRRVISKFKRNIVANQEVKASFATAITTFITKGVQAGIKRDQFGKKADIIGKAKEGPKYNDDPDMMLELCEFNPADPACVKRGNRVAGSRDSSNGTLSFDADDGVNSFNLNPASETFGEAGSETNLPDDKNNVAAINSPFKDAAQEAKGILNPADQAVVQATGGAGGGGGGGGGAGGGGGGSASLGGDLKGAQKETSGDPQVKTGKVSGSYAASGGGGYKGVGKSKEDSGNPFSSLFDQKGSEGGVEEDRTIASGDIDGKTSGLFEKISSRYSKIKADKRIEAQNLE